MKKNIYIGVAWPYVNGDLHIGHLAGYLLPADICARFNRLLGNKVLMISGSDCYGTPITLEADKKKISPTEIVDIYHAKDVDLFLNVLNLSYSLYTKTDHPNHKQVVQDIFVSLLDKGYIFIDSTHQYYSPTQERFLPDRYVVGVCPFCNTPETRSDQCDSCGKLIATGELKEAISTIERAPVVVKETQHYFLDWPKLEAFLTSYVAKTGSNWKEWVLQGTQAWLSEGLKPRAITRDIDWGVEIPLDRISKNMQLEHAENKRFYVWFDAVIGYLSGSILWAKESGDTDAWKEFWYGDNAYHYYFMGKDNLVFHTLFWPGQLYGYDESLHLPDLPSINMFLNLSGKKFSKSRNVMINSRDIVEKYGNDAVRFYLTLIMPEVRDASFVWQDFEEKNNGILVANIGNFMHRILSIAYKEDLAFLKSFKVDKDVFDKVDRIFNKCCKYLEKCEFKRFLDEVISLSSTGNKLVDSVEIWKLKEKDIKSYHQNLGNILYLIIALGYLLEPVVPHAVSKFKELINGRNVEWNQDFAKGIERVLMDLHFAAKPSPLFTKIDVTSELVS